VTELTLYCDGGSRGNPGPSAIGAVVYDSSTDPPRKVATVSERIGVTTNNVAEYRALIAGLEAVAHLRAPVIRVRADSLLVIRQLRGEWKVKHANMRPLYLAAMSLLAEYEIVDLRHVPREENADADALVNAALDA
jgi:ribonuclease HI